MPSFSASLTEVALMRAKSDELKQHHEAFLKLLDSKERDELQIHQVCVVGDTSCGKSTIINFLLGYNLNHVGAGVATRRPCELNVKEGKNVLTTTFTVTFVKCAEYATGKTFTKIADVHLAIRDLNDKIKNPELFQHGEFDKEPIILDVVLGAGDEGLQSSVGSDGLRLVDLPGTTSENDEPLEIAKMYMKRQNSIIVIIGMDDENNARFPMLLRLSSQCQQTFVIQNFTNQLVELGKVQGNYELVQRTLGEVDVYYVDPGNKHGTSGRKPAQEDWEELARQHGDNEVRRRMLHYESRRAADLRADFGDQSIQLQRMMFGVRPVAEAIIKSQEQNMEQEVESMSKRITDQLRVGEQRIKDLSSNLEDVMNSSEFESMLEDFGTFFLAIASGEEMDELLQTTEDELRRSRDQDQVMAVWMDEGTDLKMRDLLSQHAQEDNRPGFQIRLPLRAQHRRLNREFLGTLAFAPMHPITKEDLRNRIYQISQGVGDRSHASDVLVDLVYRHGGIRIGDHLKTYRRRVECMFTYVIEPMVNQWCESKGLSTVRRLMPSEPVDSIRDELTTTLIRKTMPAFLAKNLKDSINAFDNLDEWMLPLKNQVFNGQIATGSLHTPSAQFGRRLWTPEIKALFDQDQVPPPKENEQRQRRFPNIMQQIPKPLGWILPLGTLGACYLGKSIPRQLHQVLGCSTAGYLLAKHNGWTERTESAHADLPSGSLQRPLENGLLNACTITNIILYESATASYIPPVDGKSSIEDINIEVFKQLKAYHAEVAANWASHYPGALQRVYQKDDPKLHDLLPEGLDKKSVIEEFNRLLNEGWYEDRQTSMEEYAAAAAAYPHDSLKWSGIEDMQAFYKKIQDNNVPWLGERTTEKFSGSAALRRLCYEFQYALLQSPVKQVAEEHKQRALANTIGRTQRSGEEIIEDLVREQWKQELGHQKKVFTNRAKFLTKKSASFAASYLKIEFPADDKARFKEAVEEYMLRKLGDLWSELEHSAKALETSLDFGLALGRIPFGQDGLPMGCVSYKVVDTGVQPISTEATMQKFWSGHQEEPLSWKSENGSMVLKPDAVNRMYAKTLATDLESDIAAVIGKADQDKYSPKARDGPQSEKKLEGGAVQEMALRVFKSFHVQAMLVLRPHFHTLLHNMYNEKNLSSTLRMDKDLRAIKGKIMQKQRIALEKAIELEKKTQQQRRRVLDDYTAYVRNAQQE